MGKGSQHGLEQPELFLVETGFLGEYLHSAARTLHVDYQPTLSCVKRMKTLSCVSMLLILGKHQKEIQQIQQQSEYVLTQVPSCSSKINISSCHTRLHAAELHLS